MHCTVFVFVKSFVKVKNNIPNISDLLFGIDDINNSKLLRIIQESQKKLLEGS